MNGESLRTDTNQEEPYTKQDIHDFLKDGQSLEYADLSESKLIGIHLPKISFKGASLQGADLRYANLAGTIFEEANLKGTDLTGAKLTGADLSGANLEGAILLKWGFYAFLGLLGGLTTLFLSTMASHTAAFRILYGLRVRLAEHVGKLHLGYLTSTSTGAVKKTLEQNVEKIELFIAHQIPDFVNVVATVAILFFIMFSMNFWMALITIGAVVLGFLILT